MTLIKCPDCQNQISNLAMACPFCGLHFVCPECGHRHASLEAPLAVNLPLEIKTAHAKAKRVREKWLPMIPWLAILLSFGAGALWVALKPSSVPFLSAVEDQPPRDAPQPENAARPSSTSEPAAVIVPPPAPGTRVPKTEIILRLAGSKTIGAALAPALTAAYLAREGANRVKRVDQDDPDTVTITETSAPSDRPARAIEISARASQDAFQSLAIGQADIGMSSRRINSDESQTLRFVRSDVTDFEHVIALDALTVVVHPNNLVSSLPRDQVAAIFSGLISDWAPIKGPLGPINLYFGDSGSDNFDQFQATVLGKAQLATGVRGVERDDLIASAVASDTHGIGVVAMPYHTGIKVLAISHEAGAPPVLPDPITLTTGQYPLSRRLYFYARAEHPNPHVRAFIEFSLSEAGQKLVQHEGFVAINLHVASIPDPTSPPAVYAAQTQNALRLSTMFYFGSGMTQPEGGSLAVLESVTGFVNAIDADKRSLIVFGFSDDVGDFRSNVQLSKKRARSVAAALKERGLTARVVEGLGPTIPVASNATPEGRRKNRRVEIWVKSP